MRAIGLLLAMLLPGPALALDLETPFQSIDGGTLAIAQWSGQPVLVVNTASLCGFTHQYGDLQDLQDRYAARGLVVLAVPSDDFSQELESNAEVKDFCEIQFGLDLPMTEITPVKGPDAHPFYQSLQSEHGVKVGWNFNKVLLSPDGDFVQHWGPMAKPTGASITRQIEALLP